MFVVIVDIWIVVVDELDVIGYLDVRIRVVVDIWIMLTLCKKEINGTEHLREVLGE